MSRLFSIQSRRRHCGVLGFACWALFAAPGIAAGSSKHNDYQLWLDGRVSAPVAGKIGFSIETLLQITNGVSRPGLLLVRPLVTYTVNSRVSVGGGYTYLAADDHVGSNFHEHRAVEEITLKSSSKSDQLLLTSRTRLEQRFRDHEEGTQWRLREMARLDVPIGEGRRLVGSTEIFVALNQTTWGGRSRPLFLQSFAGVHFPISKKAAIEPGYINQTYFDPGANRTRHALALFFTSAL